MPIQMNLINKIGLMFGLLFYSFLASAITTEVIKKETAEYLLDIKYPQGFQSNGVNQAVKEFITNQQKSFMNELSEDADTPADAPGKTGLNITYSIPYQSTNALSVRFNISIYHRGAAHPSNAVKVLNFIKNQPVQLSDLFVPGSDYLQPIADLAKKEITAKKISDENWIKEGTKPIQENYSIWHFTKKGIAIVFNTYQVAAYVYGEQTVDIPLSLISAMVKPEISKAVWGN
ncbi:TPA: DUF3298 and DUF4163 domain-containing protein [Legionella pneumophila]|uniref:DUF3298 and DUF4163 domain-containing protein n=1 Tax=Legionella pneumophila TaxID=446 RepID=UPI000489A4C2|nr:DUF3298 and DUF4163 domain-containing protein [Legionella pneumophila]MCK1848234.1 DUF3298 and DUF4163 domain-containing protein [Legionella pneumophila]MCZ4806548.1 DUF3298 and DUF4163 domain-containing protein [Legionella pneumophila]MDI9850753.1 DUF3298 and DUF4163 domain-containing protein [Legionella pneumophila]MDO5159724.1 DUF3298 and DUF4163 domain-containing protein [Legionella pneumophila]MDO5161165.1 DUF3298 and DUF4163 domain-containing protein [Legionella pneumophila]